MTTSDHEGSQRLKNEQWDYWFKKKKIIASPLGLDYLFIFTSFFFGDDLGSFS